MLIRQSGNCQKCGSLFGATDTIQSTEVECNRCKKKKTLCKNCKNEGCDCGGKYLDAWDKNPHMMY